MNITILSLISSSVFTKSPFFVSNQLTVHNSYFKHFTSLIFYNQKNLYLENTIFKKTIGGIVINDKDESISTILKEEETFENNDSDICIDQKFVLQTTQSTNIKIIKCIFNNISCSNGNIIYIQSKFTSLNIYDSIFQSCTTEDGIIRVLDGTLTEINNTCCFESACKANTIFLDKRGSVEELNFCYNSIARSQKIGGKKNVFSDNNKQVLKYNNISCENFIGLHIQIPNEFIFSFSIINTSKSCFYLAGADSNISIENVEFYCYDCNSDSGCICFGSEKYTIEVKYSSIFAASNILTKTKSNDDCTLTLINCKIQGKSEDQKIIFETNEDCTETAFFGACPTHTFTPSSKFTASRNFTLSGRFSNSEYFTVSEKFSQSSYFTSSMMFLESSHFTPSDKFSKSDHFSHSSAFSKSSMFSQSNEFVVVREPPSVGAGNQNTDGKSNSKGKMVGIIVGVIAGVAVIGAIAAVVIIKKRKSLHVTSDIEMVDDTAFVTVDNDLHDAMKEDDPFAEEFKD